MLLRHSGQVIDSTFHPDSIAIYLLDPEDREYILAWSLAAETLPVTVSNNTVVVRALADRPLLFL